MMAKKVWYKTRIEKNVAEMRRCQLVAEKSRDLVFAIRAAIARDRNRSGVELDLDCLADPEYKAAIADNQWYMQQTIMYANTAQTEMRLLALERSNVIPFQRKKDTVEDLLNSVYPL
jgi:hypothetical protein